MKVIEVKHSWTDVSKMIELMVDTHAKKSFFTKKKNYNDELVAPIDIYRDHEKAMAQVADRAVLVTDWLKKEIDFTSCDTKRETLNEVYMLMQNGLDKDGHVIYTEEDE